ncbi:Uma2 family endonuclease [Streptomyces gobiensis]|uniref:Uma2 family endonuclease n=1 Tax=Streptomyces gobiensis TaxID=2875706 RepID=UPI001E64EA85|nr:Uma2 family endonuclease [Streptomyces gobiensis]UGY95172.1 Uma2 family endonuclease [Streptomyces gobiensis]
MDLGAFEAIAEAAAREDVRLEFISGKIGVKPVPDGDHGQIIAWLQRICMQQRPDLWLFPEQGLKVQTYCNGDARPDGSLAPAEYFAGQGEWADASGVLGVVEVTSYDHDTDRRDRVEKPRAYAETGIPVYLLIDRDAGAVTIHSEPDNGRYASVVSLAYGHTVDLPGLGITLDTDVLKNYTR